MIDRPLAVEEARAEAEQHDGNARGRLTRVVDAFAASRQLVVRTFEVEDREAFLDIAWQEIRATKVLTPPTRPRTLREAARQLDEQFTSFAAIATAKAAPGSLDPGWFDRCAAIEREGWDWSRWRRPWLVEATDGERRHSLATHLYVWEGNHSCLVLAHELPLGRVAWRPIEAVVCVAPRAKVPE